MPHKEIDFIQKLKISDPIALDTVVRRYTHQLYKACFGLGFKNYEAEDITQSVWITFFDVIIRFEGRSSLRTFLFGILYNKASEYRKQNNRAEVTDQIEEIIDSHFDSRGHWIPLHSPVSPDQFLESSENMSIITKCLELLPLPQKMAFMLKEVDEEKTDEICNILSVTATHLGVLLYRARNQLRECVDRKSR